MSDAMKSIVRPEDDPRTQFWAERIKRADVAPKPWWGTRNTRLANRSPYVASIQGDIVAVEALISEQESALANNKSSQ